ncbi:MAG TPA: HAD family phosphatase [Pirellulales bacterium]|nr:HAD family phosphatase [Pirellulales bacterium]
MPLSQRPRAVVFDLDGLLFNTEDLYQDVGVELLRRRGCQFDRELLDRMMGRPGRVALRMMIEHHRLSATVEQLAAETEEIFPAILDARLAFMPGVSELLAALESTQIPKAIATSSGRRFTLDVLTRFAIEHRFAFIITAEDVVEGKPHPEIYLQAATRFRLPPRELAVFEDSQNGCRAAVAAGTIAVAVPGGHSRGHDFSGAAMVVESLAAPAVYELLGLPRACENGL